LINFFKKKLIKNNIPDGLAGAYYGINKIPKKFKKQLVGFELILLKFKELALKNF
jgi:ADP-ribosylglycohydrolase